MMASVRTALWLAGALAASACDRGARADARPGAEPPAAHAKLERADVIRYHMQLHFDDLRAIERYLIAGQLKEARALAFMIAMPEKDRGLLPWAREAIALVDTAGKLAQAKSVDEALRLEVQVAVACAKCHDDTSETAVFPLPGRPPLSDHASSTVRMVRHQWATDRLWEGLVGNSEDHWRAGLAVITETPLPYSVATDAPALAASLQKRANQTLREAPLTIEERGRVYGEMLVTCAACHSTIKRAK